MPAEHPTKPTSVYKYYDANKLLIYVGITSTGILRNRQHNSEKVWWPFVANQEVEHFQTREDAHVREVALIHEHRPPFNTQHNREHQDLRRAYIELAQGGKLGRSFLDLVQTGEKRAIRLYHVKENIQHVVFLTYAEDAAIVAALEHVGETYVYARPRHVQCVGKVCAIQKSHLIAKIVTNVVLGPSERVVKAEAKLRYKRLKPPERVELRHLTVQIV